MAFMVGKSVGAGNIDDIVDYPTKPCDAIGETSHNKVRFLGMHK